MPTKRNDVKAFAIGSKIEYNGKLYEVIEGNYCDNCAIANICSNNDVPSSNKFANVLSRDQRLNIFGDCSNVNRVDGTDVVFKEVPMNKSDNINNNIIQPLVEPDGNIKDLQIKTPLNYEIDIDNSDLSKGIIKFKNKWLTLEQLYKLAEENNFNTYRDSIKNISGNKLLALANLMDIARYFNGDWNYDATKGDKGYMIAYDVSIAEPYYTIRKINATTDVYYGNPIFKNEDNANYVIDNPNFRVILDSIFKA